MHDSMMSFLQICKEQTSRSHLCVLLMGLSLGLLFGCSAGPMVTFEPKSPSVIIPGHEDQPLSGASLAYVQGDWLRVMSEMDRTSLATHWSMMTLNREPADDRNVSPSVPKLVIATSLMTNGQTAEIYCWPAGQGRIAVAVRAGPFGNQDKQKRFIEKLAKNLTRPPVPDRKPTFDMPTLKQYQQAHEPVYE